MEIIIKTLIKIRTIQLLDYKTNGFKTTLFWLFKISLMVQFYKKSGLRDPKEISKAVIFIIWLVVPN